VFHGILDDNKPEGPQLFRDHIIGRQTPSLTQGLPPFLFNKCGGEPRVKPGVWRPEMWAQDNQDLRVSARHRSDFQCHKITILGKQYLCQS
jgi:hypothetical protein